MQGFFLWEIVVTFLTMNWSQALKEVMWMQLSGLTLGPESQAQKVGRFGSNRTRETFRCYLIQNDCE